MTYTQHPLSAAFPSMTDAEIDALASDIAEHGQREPGVLYEGQVLDGWHRHQACERAGVEFVAVEFTGDDPVAFVISKNAHRRHLTASQRAIAVVAASEWKASHRPGNNPEPGSGLSEADMARVAHTSDRTIRQAKVAVRAGLGGAVRDGMMSTKAAVAVAKGEPPKPAKARGITPEQQRILDEGADAFEGVDALEDADNRIRALEARLAILEAEDGKAELVTAVKRFEHAESEKEGLQARMAQAARERDELERWRGQVMKATGTETPADALRTVRAWRALKDGAAA